MTTKEALEAAREALVYFYTEKADYMRRNNLGDPAREHATSLHFAALALIDAALAEQQPQTTAATVKQSLTVAPLSAELRELLDLWHGGHLQVRPEAAGAWGAAVAKAERALAEALAEQQAEPSADAPIITDAMVSAYLNANDAYWVGVDKGPEKPGVWRNGTPREATRVSLQAAFAAMKGTP